MIRLLCLLASSALGATHLYAQEHNFEVEPGQWRFEDSFNVPGLRIADSRTTTKCLAEADAQKSLSEIIRDMTGGRDNDCNVSNMSQLPGSISLDIACQTSEAGFQLQSSGRMRYEYGRTSYSGAMSGSLVLQGQEFPYEGQAFAERIGDC
ncbi:DUF3617 domain-containing protein [Loktanella sp. S4079]|uniref:DUF3617 domain-containing protein n=1 Tax=Loktanella sp. S4079 TaxID=579483 RepID=UPI0005FA8244|nr:DUF3617 family protein [Loktanella sp. S4079]KJZ18464.1 hypothetical protein TW80_13540 [Loktanella sp. S4079]